jgi:hypothetical protein
MKGTCLKGAFLLCRYGIRIGSAVQELVARTVFSRSKEILPYVVCN